MLTSSSVCLCFCNVIIRLLKRFLFVACARRGGTLCLPAQRGVSVGKGGSVRLSSWSQLQGKEVLLLLHLQQVQPPLQRCYN